MGCHASKHAEHPPENGGAPGVVTHGGFRFEKNGVRTVAVPVDPAHGLGMAIVTLVDAAGLRVDGVRVSKVNAGGSAYRSGIAVGDVIVDIDGRSVLHAPHDVVIGMLRAAKQRVTITMLPPQHHSLEDPNSYMESHIESLTLGRAVTTGQDVPQEAPVTLLSTTLHRPETSGWLVKKEGYLIKSKRGTGFKKTKTRRYFLLKVEPVTTVAELEYYEGAIVRGSITLQGAKVKPGLSGSFAIHAVDRVWYLAPENPADIQLTLSWMTALKKGIDRTFAREPTARLQPGLVPAVDAALGTDLNSDSASNDFVVDDGSRLPASPLIVSISTPPPGGVLRLEDIFCSPQDCGTIPASAVVYPGTDTRRVVVSETQQVWNVELADYSPPTHSRLSPDTDNYCTTLNGRCAAFDAEPIPRSTQFNYREPLPNALDRSSRMGLFSIDASSMLPYNPAGRTGLAGRGAFARFGPNHYGGVLLCRYNANSQVEVLVLKSNDGEEDLLPESCVAPGEHIISAVGRILRDRVLGVAMLTGSASQGGVLSEFVSTCLRRATEVYAGYLCDSRNTDNAWAEMTCFTIFDASGELFEDLPFVNKVRWVRGVDFKSEKYNSVVVAATALHAPVILRRPSRGASVSARASVRRSKAFSKRYPSEEDLTTAAAAAVAEPLDTKLKHHPSMLPESPATPPLFDSSVRPKWSNRPAPQISLPGGELKTGEPPSPPLSGGQSRNPTITSITSSSSPPASTSERPKWSNRPAPAAPRPPAQARTSHEAGMLHRRSQAIGTGHSLVNSVEARPPVMVTIEGNESGFGLEFGGAVDASMGSLHGFGVFISAVTLGSPAAALPDVRVGLQVVKANSVDLRLGICSHLLPVLEDTGSTLNLELQDNAALYAAYAALGPTYSSRPPSVLVARHPSLIADGTSRPKWNVLGSPTVPPPQQFAATAKANELAAPSNFSEDESSSSESSEPASPGAVSVDLAGAMVVGVNRTLDDEANDRLRHRCMDLIAAAKLQAPELNIQTEHVLHVVIQEYEATDDDEYSVQEGDETIVHRQDPDGWWLASRIVDGRLGYLPSTYLSPLEKVIENGRTGIMVNFLDYNKLPRFNSIRA